MQVPYKTASFKLNSLKLSGDTFPVLQKWLNITLGISDAGPEAGLAVRRVFAYL
jgi:hypothetical protein